MKGGIIRYRLNVFLVLVMLVGSCFFIPKTYATISISSPTDISLGNIVGTGSANNSVTWNIDTDNANGYQMEWQADAATLASGEDTIAAYTPAVGDTPETWSVAAANSEWGARLKSASTDADAEWGTDGASEKWLNVVVGPSTRVIVTRDSATTGDGSDQIVEFKAEVGLNHWQPTGIYTVNVTITVTEL